MLLVEVGDDLGVGLRAQRVAPGQKLVGQIGCVVDLAVADRPDALVLVGEGGRLGGDVDDCEPTKTQSAVFACDVTLAVGTAVDHGRSHGVHQLPTLGVGLLTPDDAHQSTHFANLLPRALESGILSQSASPIGERGLKKCVDVCAGATTGATFTGAGFTIAPCTIISFGLRHRKGAIDRNSTAGVFAFGRDMRS